MNILILGDIAFTGIVSRQPDKNKQRYQDIEQVLNDADLVFINLEVPVKTDESRNENKNFIHYSLPKPTEDLLTLLNIGCVSLPTITFMTVKCRGSKRQLFAIKHSSSFAARVFNFKEKILDRTHEYFFGYYKHPLKRLTQFSNIHKIKRLFNDFRQG